MGIHIEPASNNLYFKGEATRSKQTKIQRVNSQADTLTHTFALVDFVDEPLRTQIQSVVILVKRVN